jgi:hypothetical protein
LLEFHCPLSMRWMPKTVYNKRETSHSLYYEPRYYITSTSNPTLCELQSQMCCTVRQQIDKLIFDFRRV